MIDLIWYATVGALVVAIAVIAALAYKLHRAGVSNADLPGQVGLKAQGMADALADQILAAMAKQNEQRGLKDAYFDRDELISDLARLPQSYTRTVKLDAAIKREGVGEPVEYLTQPNGNVARK